MISALIVFFLTTALAYVVINATASKYRGVKQNDLFIIYVVHIVMSAVYYMYSVLNSSDSRRYFRNVSLEYKGSNWFSYYRPGTEFIEFASYPFVKIGLGYEAMMILFSFFGFLGFIYFYRLFKERTRFQHKLFGYDLMLIFFLLPNMHFWTGSLGKGSLIFLGLGLFVYGMSDFKKRIPELVIGTLIIFNIRMHILLVFVAGASLGLVFSKGKLTMAQKYAGALASLALLVYVFNNASIWAGFEDLSFFASDGYVGVRGRELSRTATSGIDIGNYNLFQKVFAFLYRPLFIDSVNALGLFVSIENVFYLYMTFKLFNRRALNYLLRSDYMIKMCFIAFIGISVALSNITGNLGIAIRQKTQVMFLLLFVVLQFMDFEKMKAYRAWKRRRQQNLRNVA